MAPRQARRERVERWFIDQGVPHFSEGYTIVERLPLIACPLFAALAFEVSMAPLLDLTAFELLLALGCVIAMAVLALPALADFIGFENRWKRRPSWVLRCLLLVAAVVLLVLVQVGAARAFAALVRQD